MALNKRKVLDAARKYAQKGAKEKALKEYAKLLKEDSRDAKLLLEVGDAHRRWGQNEEAISHYVRVADQYMQGGFDARAVAVFKQILNLDEKRYPAYVSLAELYQRMGLDSEAVNALQTAADGYHKEGQKHEALELLRKMATLDPSNTTSRIKVAELLRQEELVDESIAEFEAVVDELVRQGASDELVPVYERILEMRPDRADIEFALARNLVQQGQPERAEPFARRAFDNQKDGEGHFDLVCGVYAELDRASELTDVTKAMAQVYRARGDDDLARELMQRLPSDSALDADANASGGDQLLGDDDFLDDDFLATDDDDNDDSFIDISGDDDLELDLGDEAPAAADATDSKALSGSQVSLPEGDPDQLFAEASVYVRYGKRDQAIASLEAILAQEPEHRDALEKIGECYADAGDTEKAVAYWLDAAALAQAGDDDSVVDVLRERIAVLDPAAAQTLVRKPRGHSGPEAEQTIAGTSATGFVDADDSELDLDDMVNESAGSESAVPEAVDDESDDDEFIVDLDDGDAVSAAADVDDEIDVELDLDFESEDDDDANAMSASDAGESSDEISLSDSIEVDVDVSGASGVAAGDGLSASPAETSLTGAGAGNSTRAELVREELEEAEFYMEQQLFDEAEAIYKRVLEVSPKHPSALLRMGELRAARGEDPDSPELSGSVQNEVTLDPADLPFEDSEDDSSFEVSDEFDGNDSPIDLGADSELEIAVELDVNLADDEEVDAEAIDPDEIEVDDSELSQTDEVDEDATHDASLFETDDEGDSNAQSSAGGEYEVEIDFADDDDDNVGVELASEDDGADGMQYDNTMPLYVDDDDEATGDTVRVDVAAGASEEDDCSDVDEDDSFDLAAELRETIEEEDERDEQQAAQAQGAATSEEEGIASIFKDFKSGVAKTLAEDDFDTRFDLGIAYRGMELYDDALGEFQICLGSAGHKIESLHMMGLCAIDLGRFADASNHLEQALSCGELPTQKEAGLRFDLARSFEALRDFTRAKEAFEAAKEADATMPGINDCIARVEAALEGEASPVEVEGAGAESEGFENFDDLVAEVEAEDEADAPEETFESFDDVIAEVEADGVMADDASEPAEVVEEPEPEEAAPEASEPKSGKKKPKKKRISFV